MAATRPPMTLGLPHTLSISLIAAALMFFLLYSTGNQVNDAVADVLAVGLIGMVWSAAKILLRTDYHGWDNFIAWVRLDGRCLDTAEWGGARLASVRSDSQASKPATRWSTVCACPRWNMARSGRSRMKYWWTNLSTETSCQASEDSET